MNLITALLTGVLVAAGALVLVYGLRTLWRIDDTPAVLAVTGWLAGAAAVISSAVALLTAATALVAGTVDVDVPVSTFWPGIPDGATLTGLDATIASGGFDTASLSLSGLSTGARLALASSTLLSYSATVAILVVVAVACRQAQAGEPFSPLVARTAIVAAVVVATGGMLGQVADGIGSNLAAQQALDHSGYAAECRGGCPDIATWWPEWVPRFQLEFWPIGAALVLAALAIVWRHGNRLQRDTEGLV